MEIFGCKLSDPNGDVDGKFKFSPHSHTVFFNPDAPHMLKLARNVLADLGILFSDGDEKIESRYISMLNDIQFDEGLKFANKFFYRYINFQHLKMKVNVAAQTLSSSIAEALQFLMEASHPDFKNASATIQFIRIIDKVFDLLDSNNLLVGGFKSPLKMIDRKIWVCTIEESISYLLKLSEINWAPFKKTQKENFRYGFYDSIIQC